MVFKGFTQADFAVFSVPGFEERMSALKLTVRPKLEALGKVLAPRLAELTGMPMYAHVAKHARRTVNPPKDTWVAWSGNARGYKAHPHFQVGLWETHVFAWFALIDEAPCKSRFARQLRASPGLWRVPESYVWSGDHTQPGAIAHGELDEEAFARFLERIEKTRRAEALCGIHLLAGDPILRQPKQLVERFEEVFETTLPFYKLAQAANL